MTNSCELCRQRKIKCDKAKPCSACIRSGTPCIFKERPRLPRGRNGGRRQEPKQWQERLARLETLVETLQSRDPKPPDINDTAKTDDRLLGAQDAQMSGYLGAPFWSALSAEVEGLRDVLSAELDDSEGEIDTTSPSVHVEPQELSPFNFLLSSGSEVLIMDSKALRHPPLAVRQKLLSIYSSNFDSIIKVIHEPTIRFQIEHTEMLNQDGDADAPVNALLFAVYYAAVMTETDYDCLQLFGQSRLTLLKQYRLATEIYLSKGDFLSKQSLVTLPAFFIYLVSMRQDDDGQRQWTMMSLAVRLARVMGLHKAQASAAVPPLEQELRNRLWHQIRVLDYRSSLDRGTEPIISAGSYDTLRPLNISDSDIDSNTTIRPPPSQEITHSTFSILTAECSAVVAGLNYIPEHAVLTEQDWKQRHVLADDFERFTNQYLPHCDLTIPLHWYIRQTFGGLTSFIRLVVVRPLWRQRKPAAPEPYNNKILKLAMVSLHSEKLSMSSPFAQSYRWHFWVQWYVLAVALVELCAQPNSQTALEAWGIVQDAYGYQAQHVADSRRGALWQPIKRLMKRAQAVREAHGASKLLFDAVTDPAVVRAEGVPQQNFVPEAHHSALAWDGQVCSEPFGENGLMDTNMQYNVNEPMVCNDDLAAGFWDSFIADFTNTSSELYD